MIYCQHYKSTAQEKCCVCDCGETVEINDMERCEECGDLFCADHFTYCDFSECICNDCYVREN